MKLLTYFLLLTLFLSCTQNKINFSGKILNIDPIEAKDSIKLSDICDSVFYIPLMTDDDFLIGKIDKLLITEDYIFILDRKLGRSVYCFDKKGNKKFKIHRVGRGVGEYVDIKDISYDKYTQELLVYCYIRQCIMSFDLKGNFLHEVKVPFYFVRFSKLKDAAIAVFCEYNANKEVAENNNYPNILLLSPSLQVKDKNSYFSGFIDKSVVWNTKCDFSFFEDTVGIKPDHNNVIYHITKEGIKPVYFINFGKYNINEKYWQKTREKGIKLNDIEKFDLQQQYCENMFYNENKKFIYFEYRQNNKRKKVFYSKKSKKIIHVKKVINDIDGFSKLTPFANYEGTLYSILSAGNICKYRKKLTERHLFPLSLVKEVKEDDNPILVAFKIKEF